MINLTEFKRIADKYQINLHETSNGTFIFELDHIDGVKPLLITTGDDGLTWCVEAMGKGGKMWSGHVSLRGLALEREIRSMYGFLDLGSPERMIQIATDLQSVKNLSRDENSSCVH